MPKLCGTKIECDGTQPVLEGRFVCALCAPHFDRFRAEMKEESARRMGKRKKRQVPSCCLPSCDEPRARGKTYCVVHEEEFESEEEEAA